MYCGVNLTKLLVTTAVGDLDYYRSLASFRRSRRHMIAFSAFSEEEGILDQVSIDPILQPHLIDHRYMHGIKRGDPVRSIRDASRPVSVAVFAFDSARELEAALIHMERLVHVDLLAERC